MRAILYGIMGISAAAPTLVFRQMIDPFTLVSNVFFAHFWLREKLCCNDLMVKQFLIFGFSGLPLLVSVFLK